MTQDEIKTIIEKGQQYAPRLDHNHNLLEIFEGDLLKFVLSDLQKQLSPKSFEAIKHRISPINLLRKLIEKLSTLYNSKPTRTITPESESQKSALDFYVKELDFDANMTSANEMFNLYKNTAIEFYVDGVEPKMRVIPSDRFYVCSNDPVNPLRVTHFVKIMGLHNKKQVYYVYTDTEFLIVDNDGVVLDDLMQLYGSDGTNPYGKIPFVYMNRSKYELMPRPDSDLMTMIRLFPVLLSDLNFAVMFQSFSVTYGIDVNFDNIEHSPNAFWSIKSDATKDTKPEVGTIKPEVDIPSVMSYIHDQLKIWLNTRNIRAGELTSNDKSMTGISKAIDEMDTTEDRKKQITHFTMAEADAWYLIVNHLHPQWMKMPGYALRYDFAYKTEVKTEFAEIKSFVSDTEIIDQNIKLIEKMLRTRKRAIMMIEKVDEKEAEKIIEAINAETEAEMPEDPMEEMQSDETEVEDEPANLEQVQ
jgi:hypothetical protein